MEDNWIYARTRLCLIQFRVKSKRNFFCSCTSECVVKIEFTARDDLRSYHGTMCESCWQKALCLSDVVFLTPEEGRAYFDD